MKIFKYLTIVFLLLPPFHTVSLAQVGVIVNAAKAGVKKEAKQAAKAGVKQVVKAEIKQAAKAETKQFIKSETKQAVKAEMKNAIKAEAKQAAKTEVKNAIKAETKTALKTESRQIAKKEASLTTKRTLNSDLGKKSFSSFNKNTGKNVVLEQSLKKDVLQTWERYAGTSLEKKEILRMDLQQKPELIAAFNKNPQLLEIYHNFINSPKYRTDLTLLRYGENNASKTSLMYVRGPRNRTWLTGNSITLEDNAGVTVIRQKETGRLLGKLEGNINDGYIVNIHGNSDPALLDLYPMRNTTYFYGNCSWTTDNLGRPIIVKMRANKGIAVGGREEGYIKKVKQFKTEYDVNGEQLKANGVKYDDIAGHMAADGYGGPSCGINIVPQNATMNNSGIWKSSEIHGLNLAKQGNAVERTIVIKYPDNLSQRPSSFSISQTVNGKYDFVNGTEMKNVELLNL